MAGACTIDPLLRGKRSTHGLDRAASALAERQHGLVARRQLLAVGFGPRALEVRLEKGILKPVYRGVYAVGFRPAGREVRWMAAVLACGPHAVVSHRSAAQLWGLLCAYSGPIEVTRTNSWRAPAGVLVHRTCLPDDERTVVDGIPVTTVPRTVLDFAAGASRRQVERGLNEMEVRGLTDQLSIPDLLARYPGRPGTVVLRDLLDGGTGRGGVTENDFEERFVSMLDSHGLPRPRFNADVSVAGRFFSVDCLWRRERLIVELDGRAVHGTPKAFEGDRERDRLLTADGWRVMRITWRQLRDDTARIAADLRAALRCAA